MKRYLAIKFVYVFSLCPFITVSVICFLFNILIPEYITSVLVSSVFLPYRRKEVNVKENMDVKEIK